MTGETTTIGRITISPRAIATIACQAAMQSYGVVGLTCRNLANEIAYVFTRNPEHGVHVNVIDDLITIDLYVVVEYGTRISSVAASVANTVHYHVERAIGLPIAAVNVHVQDLRITDTEI
jgi:uncharacterized alkaline shock family protein YloU